MRRWTPALLFGALLAASSSHAVTVEPAPVTPANQAKFTDPDAALESAGSQMQDSFARNNGLGAVSGGGPGRGNGGYRVPKPGDPGTGEATPTHKGAAPATAATRSLARLPPGS